MIIAYYVHRLPADYDIGIIRERAKRRGPVWDAFPGLHFKGFLLRERGRLGAIASEYSSLYLWQHDQAFRDAMVEGRYKTVTDSFGRAAIETRVALDARKGRGREARFAYKEQRDIPLDADLTAALAAEIARNREIAGQADVVAAAVGLDPGSWTFTRIVVSEREPAGRDGGTAYEVLHLARPLLNELPPADRAG
jgi:Domain of unknown function (DUF4865)